MGSTTAAHSPRHVGNAILLDVQCQCLLLVCVACSVCSLLGAWVRLHASSKQSHTMLSVTTHLQPTAPANCPNQLPQPTACTSTSIRPPCSVTRTPPQSPPISPHITGPSPNPPDTLMPCASTSIKEKNENDRLVCFHISDPCTLCHTSHLVPCSPAAHRTTSLRLKRASPCACALHFHLDSLSSQSHPTSITVRRSSVFHKCGRRVFYKCGQRDACLASITWSTCIVCLVHQVCWSVLGGPLPVTCACCSICLWPADHVFICFKLPSNPSPPLIPSLTRSHAAGDKSDWSLRTWRNGLVFDPRRQ